MFSLTRRESEPSQLALLCCLVLFSVSRLFNHVWSPLDSTYSLSKNQKMYTNHENVSKNVKGDVRMSVSKRGGGGGGESHHAKPHLLISHLLVQLQICFPCTQSVCAWAASTLLLYTTEVTHQFFTCWKINKGYYTSRFCFPGVCNKSWCYFYDLGIHMLWVA